MEGSGMSRNMRWLVGLAAALVLWTAMAWVWVTVSGNAHVCGILSPAAVGAPELTEAEQQELTRERCGPRPSVADFVVFGTGYVVILAVFAVRAERRSDESRDDPLVPGA
jgi:hypothetical protein